MKFAKTLNRNEMKNIVAGGGDTQLEQEQGDRQKCCWEGTNNCSECIYNSAGRCVSGAELVDC